MKILCLTSSILNDFSVSNALVKDLVDHLKAKYGDVSIIEKNLGENPPAHLTLDVMTAIRTNDLSKLTKEQATAYQQILTAIEELKSADMVIIGSPMYNLSVSSGLKNWIDQICQAGLTFKYTEKGPQGLVNNKPTFIVSSRGGIYSSAPYDVLDHQEPYLKSVLALIGITDVTVIRAEGTNISPEMKEQAIAQAKQQIAAL